MVLALPGCGGGGAGATRSSAHGVVASVGRVQISSSTLAHWMKVMAPHHLVPDPPRYGECVAHDRARARQGARARLREECRTRYQALERRALRFLITSQWVIGEAADEGMGTFGAQAHRLLAEQQSASSRSAAELAASLKASSQNVAGAELELQAELAAEKLRQRHTAARVADADIAAYYRRHAASFHVAEERSFYIADFLPSEAAARRVIREVRRGKSIASFALHESLSRSGWSWSTLGPKRPLYEAIFAAKPHVLAGPVRVKRFYFVVEILSVVPAHVESLSQARAAIDAKLSGERQRRALASFTASMSRKWVAQTDCRAGYVVQKCRQYAGPQEPEEPLTIG